MTDVNILKYLLFANKKMNECMKFICCIIIDHFSLTLKMHNFLNGISHLPLLKLSIIIFRDIKLRRWSANNIQGGRSRDFCLQ